jgi:hypothetical protein
VKPRKGLGRVLPPALLLAATLLVTDARAITIVDPGTAVIDTAVNCDDHAGQVVVRTGVHFQEGEVDLPNGVSLAFRATAGSALDCCWLQFMRASAVATIGTQQSLLSGTIPATGGPLVLTTVPTAPNWRVDSAGRSPATMPGAPA